MFYGLFLCFPLQISRPSKAIQNGTEKPFAKVVASFLTGGDLIVFFF